MSEVNVDILKQEILSLLVSAKNGLSEHELLNDYRLFNSNRDLPYRDLGYPSLSALLRSWPDVCRFQQQGNNGATRILAVEEKNTKHILSMVRGQRQNKSRRRGRGGQNQGRGEGRNVGRGNRGAPFSQGSFHSNHNRPGGNVRGRSNGRVPYNNNRFQRPMGPPRPPMRQTSQNSRGKPNDFVPPRPAKQPPQQQQQQQQNRPYSTSASQPPMSSYDSRQSNNPNFLNDRCVINNSASLRITVGNNGHTNRHNSATEIDHDPQYPSDIPSRFAEYQLNEDEEQYDEDEDSEEQAINNLQTLLVEYSHGIRLLVLDDLYKSTFGKSLLAELKLANILLLQDYVDEFASISRQGEENGSCDHIITLRDPKQVAQTQAQLLQQITDSGIVPQSFRYANNLFSYINDSRFQGFISDIDKNEHCLHVQPVRYQEHIETLMEELDSYYSSPISNCLIVKNIETGLSCVTKYDGTYHRVFIKESDLYKCVLVFVDYGTTEEINKDEQQFKYLLNHFAELPQMALACRLDDVFFLPDDSQWLPNTYNEVHILCQHGPFYIETTGSMNGLLTIRVLDADGRSLNDIVVELNLAIRISAVTDNAPINQPPQQQPNVPRPVALTFDFLSDAVQCPLPDSRPSTPDSHADNSHFKLPENPSSQLVSHPSNTERQYKLIQVDGDHSFYLIRYNNNKPYIPCFNLARLLRLSESEILSETLLQRIRFSQTPENYAVFDCLKQTTDFKDCPHMHQNFLVVFDLPSVVNYVERLGSANNTILLEALRQQIDTFNEPQFWSTVYDCYKRPTPILSVQSSHQNDVERCNELLARRNMLCNMFRTNDLTECTLELESIENELQQVIEKMRSGSTNGQNGRGSATPGFSKSSEQGSTVNKTNKLRDLMQRCKKLINTILVLDDYVSIDDGIIKYIQENLPFLNSSKNASQDERLYQHYSELLENLTRIVDNLRQQLPDGVNL